MKSRQPSRSHCRAGGLQTRGCLSFGFPGRILHWHRCQPKFYQPFMKSAILIGHSTQLAAAYPSALRSRLSQLVALAPEGIPPDSWRDHWAEVVFSTRACEHRIRTLLRSSR